MNDENSVQKSRILIIDDLPANLTKPVQLEKLFSRVTTHLRVRSLQTQVEAQNYTLTDRNRLKKEE